MKKFFVLLFGLIMVTVMGGCLNFAAISPFLNQAPAIISEPIITATENNQYSYQLEVNDPEGDNLTYYLFLSPDGMNINGENGLIIWIPTNDQVGIHQIIIEISDGKQSVTQSFEIEVININNPPQIFFYSPANIDIKINEGDSMKFEVQAHDIDLNTALSYQWLLNGKKVSSSTVLGNDSQSRWIYSAGYGDYSQKIVKVLVSDGKLEDHMQWNIAIKETSPPVSATLNTITSPTNISLQILSGTKEAITSIWINGTEVVPLDSSTDWSYSYNLSEGINNISITSRDTAGNESPAVTAIIILDTINPAAPTLDAVVSPTNISPQILSGTKETNTSVWIDSLEVVPINLSNTWNYDFNLSEGNNNISITSRDSAGNESSGATAKIILDSILPTTPTLNEVITPTNISIQVLFGSKETNSSIWLNGVEVVHLNSSVNWSYSYNLSEGTNNISITSRDAVGNESSAITATIEYDPNIYVDAANTTGIEDGTESRPFNTITEGIDAVALGKSVIVIAATYNEQLIINKEGITLQGEDKENTFINGASVNGNLIILEADFITLTGFTIDGNGSASVGIYFDNYSFIDINNNIIQNNTSYGINYRNSSPTIENNNIKSNNYSGIDVGTGGAGIIRNNFVVSNKYGIRTYGDSCPEITRNNISNNNTGIYCRESAIPIISYNTISNNTGYGILIDDVLGNLVNPDIGGGEGGSTGKNNINGNYIHGVRNKTTHNIYAKYNWWGNITGPKYPYHTSSSGDWAFWSETGSEIIFTPHLTTEP